MKKYIIISLVVTLLFSCTTDRKKAYEHYLKAKELVKQGDIKNAFAEIDNAIALDSTNLDFQIVKAQINYEADNYEEAISILKGLLSKNFKADTVNYRIGAYYFEHGMHFYRQNEITKANEAFEKATIYYNYAINKNIKYYNAYVEKQRALHNLKRYDEALVVINTALKLFPDEIILIGTRGIEKIYLGDLTGALTDLNQAIESDKLDSTKIATAYRFRGNLYIEKDNFDQAIMDYTRAIEYDPKDELALYNRALCYQEKGLKDKACEDFRKAAELGYIKAYKIIKEYCND